MSNSTQNKVFNDLPEKDQKDIIRGAMEHAQKLQDEVLTQNDEIGKMERAINEGFAESEKDLKNKRTPLDRPPTQNKGQSEWPYLTFPVEFPDRNINFKLSMYARTTGHTDLSQIQASGESMPISDTEILKRMFKRRISRPFWSSINRVRSLFSKDE